jgi:hypothetical protein
MSGNTLRKKVKNTTHNQPSTRVPTAEPWHVDVTGHDSPPCCSCTPPTAKAPKPPCTRSHPKNENCSELLLDLLNQKERDNCRRKFHKPKAPPKVKLANWCCDWPVRDAIGPIMVLLYLRAQKRLAPKNDFEEAMYKFLDALEPEKREAFQIGVDGYLSIPDARRCGFETRFDNWPDERPLDPEFLAKVIAQEVISLGRYGVFNKKDGAASAGEMRLWEQPFGPLKNEFDRAMVSGPWPWICAVNPGADDGKWYRNHDVVLPDKSSFDAIEFDLHEFSMICAASTDASNPSVVNVNCEDKITSIPGGFDDCEGGGKYNYIEPITNKRRCLSIPMCVAGQGIALRGFNFTSLNCTVTIKKRGGDFPDIEAACDVMGDDNPSTKNASCDIRDHLTFTLPKSVRDGKNDRAIPPGLYTVEVHVPNETNFAPSPGPAPSEFVSNTALINIIPPLDIPYQVWVERGNCYEETSGMGDDEPWFRGYTATYLKDGNHSIATTSQDIFRQEDIESGDWIGFPPVNLFSGKFDVGGAVAIAIQGLEVDSEDAAEQQVTSFREAYELYFEQLITRLAGGAAGGPFGYGLGVLIDTGKITASLVVGGLALAFIAAGGVFFAVWAPADPIAYDLLVFDAVSLFLLTTPGASLPPQDAGTIGGITFSTYPKGFTLTSTVTAEYREERQYRSDDEESQYGLDFKINRLPT